MHPQTRQGVSSSSSSLGLDAMKSNSSNFDPIMASMGGAAASPMDVFEGHHLYHPYADDRGSDGGSPSPPATLMTPHPPTGRTNDLLLSPKQQQRRQNFFFAQEDDDAAPLRGEISAANQSNTAGPTTRPSRGRTMSQPTPKSSRSPLGAYNNYRNAEPLHADADMMPQPTDPPVHGGFRRGGGGAGKPPPPPPSVTPLTARASQPQPRLKPRLDVMMDEDSDRAERSRRLMAAGLLVSPGDRDTLPHFHADGPLAKSTGPPAGEGTPLFSKMQDLQRRDDPDFGLPGSSASVLCGFCCSWMCWTFVWIGLFAAVVKQDGWTRVDRVYFASSTFWLVGYGDFAPTTARERILTAAYMVLSMCLFGLALGRWGNSTIEAYKAASLAQQHATTSAGRPGQPGGAPNGGSNTYSHGYSFLHPTNYYGSNYSSTRSSNNNNNSNTFDGKDFLMFPGLPWLLVQSIFLTALSVLCVFGIQYCEQGQDNGEWTAVSTIYYAVSTACTIGLGDVVPTGEGGRALAIIFLPLSVGTTLHWMVWLAQKGIQRMQRNLVHRRDLRLDEFYERKLQKMGLVDAATFRALKREYEQLS